MPENRRLLLHICCAPCGGGCVDRPEMGTGDEREVTLFYSNSNLNSQAEFDKRLKEVERLAEIYHLPLIVDPYDHEAWLQAVAGLENEPECGARCRKCFEFNLKRSAEMASGGAFATTLTVSPRKSSKVIFETGSRWENFEPRDFKKKNGYLTGRNIALKYGFYRQNYCGCEFSMRGIQENKED